MGEEYRRQTAAKLCPLKDEPWQRHEWTKGVRFVDSFLKRMINDSPVLTESFFKKNSCFRESTSWLSCCEVRHGAYLD